MRYGGGDPKELPIGDMEAKPGNISGSNFLLSAGQVLGSDRSTIIVGMLGDLDALALRCSDTAFGSWVIRDASDPTCDISVSFERFRLWYGPLKDFLRFHQQRNTTRRATRTAPTTIGTAMSTMLVDDPFGELGDGMGGAETAPGELVLAGKLELVAISDIGEEVGRTMLDLALVVIEVGLGVALGGLCDEVRELDDEGARTVLEEDGTSDGFEVVETAMGGGCGIGGVEVCEGTPFRDVVASGEDAGGVAGEIPGSVRGPCVEGGIGVFGEPNVDDSGGVIEPGGPDNGSINGLIIGSLMRSVGVGKDIIISVPWGRLVKGPELALHVDAPGPVVPF